MSTTSVKTKSNLALLSDLRKELNQLSPHRKIIGETLAKLQKGIKSATQREADLKSKLHQVRESLTKLTDSSVNPDLKPTKRSCPDNNPSERLIVRVENEAYKRVLRLIAEKVQPIIKELAV